MKIYTFFLHRTLNNKLIPTKNDFKKNPGVTEPLYCMCDCFYLHGQARGCDSVGCTVFVHSPSTLLDCEPPTRPVPCDWAVYVDHDVMWLAVGFEKHLYICIGFSSIHGSVCLGSLTAESCSRAWTQLGFFSQSLTCLHMLDWLFCLTHPWLASCQSTPLVFFDSIVEWILEILHRTEIRVDLLHLMSCFHGWQVQ